MKLKYTGTVQGEAALKHLDFMYRNPINPCMDIWSLDPERLYYNSEYPRSTNPPSENILELIELADYTVQAGSIKNNGRCDMQIWLQPNEYTAAKEPRLAFEVEVDLGLVDDPDTYEHIVDVFFRKSE